MIKQITIRPNRSALAIQDAFSIFAQIDGPKHDSTINALITLCSNSNDPSRITSIWSDIEHSLDEQALSELDLPALFKCCVSTTDSVDIDRCIQILHWIKSTKYPISKHHAKAHSMATTKLISRCRDKTYLHRIEDALCDPSVFVVTRLTESYFRHSLPEDALRVFNAVSENEKDAVLLSTVLKGLMARKQHREALAVYLEHGALADNVCHLMALKMCRMTNDFEGGKAIHSKIRWDSSSTDYDVSLRTALMSFYGDFGAVTTALALFDDVMVYRPNGVTVNAMMTILVENGWCHLALSLYLDHLHHADDVSHLKALSACIQIDDFELGKSVHFGVEEEHRSSVSLKHSLIDFYGHFGGIQEAQRIFEGIAAEDRDWFSIGSMMKALIRNGLCGDALSLYHSHRSLQNDVCHTLAVTACKVMGDLESGQAIHRQIESERHRMSLELQNALISFYGHFGDIPAAELLFGAIPHFAKDAVTINTMMSLYVDRGENEKALRIYDGFRNLNNERSHFFAVRAARNGKDFERGKAIHSKLGRNQDVHLNAALIAFYGDFGRVDAAENVFKAVHSYKRTEVVINAMMSVFVEAEQPQKALDFYHFLAVSDWMFFNIKNVKMSDLVT